MENSDVIIILKRMREISIGYFHKGKSHVGRGCGKRKESMMDTSKTWYNKRSYFLTHPNIKSIRCKKSR